MPKRNALPYWLAGGTESCDFCTHTYVLQAEYRCVACDRASCEHCIVVVREPGEVFCPECLAEEEG